MTAPEADRLRTFSAFPARKRRRGTPMARSWPAGRWIETLEETALEAAPLRQGRALAHSGRVGPISARPGRLAAAVEEGRALHSAAVAVEELPQRRWDRFAAAAARRSGDRAALEEGELPRGPTEAADLPPALGEMDFDCDCPEGAHPCRHAAALAYQAAWLLEEDPFVLVLLRGRTRGELLASLPDPEREKAAPKPRPFAGTAPLPAAPPPPAPADAALDAAHLPEPPAPLEGAELRRLAHTAARRARALLEEPRPEPSGRE